MNRALALLMPALLLAQAPAIQHVRGGSMCVGAQLAVVRAIQEKHTPPGEWCQRPTTPMPAKAHACTCHQHDCSDPDPLHVSAHTDTQCLNYCTVQQCNCAMNDCP
jgi:hypothetical protein